MRTEVCLKGGADRLPILIAAPNQDLVEFFLRKHQITRKVKRIIFENDIRGYGPPAVLVLLPGAESRDEIRKVLSYWRHIGGGIVRVSEDELRGKKRLCPNDTDDDGDCQFCAHCGHCAWPYPPSMRTLHEFKNIQLGAPWPEEGK